MPQMAPINWTILFFIFLLTYLLFNIINYSIFTPKIKQLILTQKKLKFMNWKW